MDIAVYTFEDRDGNEQGWQTQDYHEAETWASKNAMRVIENTYEWADSELVDDFTGGEEEEGAEGGSA